MSDFYEQDEDPEDVKRAFASGYRGVTSPNFGQMVGPTENVGNLATTESKLSIAVEALERLENEYDNPIAAEALERIKGEP